MGSSMARTSTVKTVRSAAVAAIEREEPEKAHRGEHFLPDIGKVEGGELL